MGKTYKSFRYSNNLVWDAARRGRTSAPGKPDIAIGSPPEFKGEAGVWAPEEMLVAALNACMMLTFVAFAQGKKLAFVAYESAAEGLLANVDGKYRIVEVSVRPILVLKSEADIEAAERSCEVSKGVIAPCPPCSCCDREWWARFSCCPPYRFRLRRSEIPGGPRSPRRQAPARCKPEGRRHSRCSTP